MANTLANFALYTVLYAVLTFYCWECTEALSLNKLWIIIIVGILWIINFVISVAVWSFAIRKNIDHKLGRRRGRGGVGAGPSGTNGSSTSTLAVADADCKDDYQPWNSANTQL